jgi:hypothetical protein
MDARERADAGEREKRGLRRRDVVTTADARVKLKRL